MLDIPLLCLIFLLSVVSCVRIPPPPPTQSGRPHDKPRPGPSYPGKPKPGPRP
ncbi:hypothetical protein MKX01_000512 [Papaver californicum]|nr:hypothetical protein MKX01_000512 [Papaver californicum]